MDFFIPGEEKVKFDTIKELFESLKKLSRLSVEQGESLKEYETQKGTYTDFAIEMPAGHGKTLVGGLMAEFNRINEGWSVVYACATNQLAKQTHELLLSYGIQSVLLIGKKSGFSRKDLGMYERGEAICVTVYGHIFNTHPEFKNPDMIIFDDAHATEYSINDLWSMKINRNKYKTIFEGLIETLGDAISPKVLDRVVLSAYDPLFDSVDLINFNQWYRKIDNIRAFLESKVNETDLFYPWYLIRDHLHACQIFISYSDITIKPILAPNLEHAPFKNAKERVYMSATLGESGELERILGAPNIFYIKKFERYSNKVSGRRLILFPEEHFEVENYLEALSQAIDMQPRTLILTPNHKQVSAIKSDLAELVPTYEVLVDSDIENDITVFSKCENKILTLAGRYEGIDLKDDDCRLQIIHEIPTAINLTERFLQERLSANELLKNKITTRLIQGLGRTTRSNQDYAVVLFTGRNIGKYLFKEEFKKSLPAEVQAEINFGINQIQYLNTIESWVSTIDAFYKQDSGWKKVEAYLSKETKKINESLLEQEESEVIKALNESKINEINYLYSLWNGNYDLAHKEVEKVITKFSRKPELKGYRAWWNYLIACIGVLQNNIDKVNEFTAKSLGATNNKLWLDVRDIKAAEDEIYDYYEELQADRILRLIEENFSNPAKLNRHLKSVQDGLNEKEAKIFEKALLELGKLLGYNTYYLEGEGTPDNVWNIENTWISFEAKTNIENPNGFIPLEDIRQVAFHDKKVQEEFKLDPQTPVSLIMICEKNKIKTSTVHAGEGIHLINNDIINDIFQNIEKIIRVVSDKLRYDVIDDIKPVIITHLKENNLTYDELSKRFIETKIVDLAVK